MIDQPGYNLGMRLQNVRNSGLSYVATELLTHNDGNEIYVREIEAAMGRTLDELVND